MILVLLSRYSNEETDAQWVLWWGCCCYVASVISDCMQPHRRQPTRLPHPWDSPGKNTGMGCHFLLQSMKVKLLSCVRLLATPWTAAHQAPPSMGFSRQEYWSGVPLPSLGEADLSIKRTFEMILKESALEGTSGSAHHCHLVALYLKCRQNT